MTLQLISSLDQVVVLKSVDAPHDFEAHKLLGPSSCPKVCVGSSWLCSSDQVVVLKSIDAPHGFAAHKLLGPSSCPKVCGCSSWLCST